MTSVLSPLVSEFETPEQAASYDRWLRAKVQRAIDSQKPRVPHDQVMTEMRELLEAKRQKSDAD